MRIYAQERVQMYVHCRIVQEGKTGNNLNVYQQENGKTNSCNKSALQ